MKSSDEFKKEILNKVSLYMAYNHGHKPRYLILDKETYEELLIAYESNPGLTLMYIHEKGEIYGLIIAVKTYNVEKCLEVK